MLLENDKKQEVMHVYMGNGVAREFPLPEGCSVSHVYMTLGGSRPMRMYEGGGFKIVGDCVVFDLPPPEGALVSFEERAGSEAVIDPARLLEDLIAVNEYGSKSMAEAKRSLTEAEEFADRAGADIREAVREAEVRLEELACELRAADSEYIEKEVGKAASLAEEFFKRRMIEFRNKHKEATESAELAQGSAERAECAARSADNAVKGLEGRVETLFVALTAELEKVVDGKLAEMSSRSEALSGAESELVGRVNEANVRYGELKARLERFERETNELEGRRAVAERVVNESRQGTILKRR